MIPAVEACIDLDALKHNLQRVKQSAPRSKVMAVIKANGYGHGMLRMARALAEADALVVARVDEALQLRQAGIEKELIVLEGFSEPADIELLANEAVQMVIHHPTQIKVLEQVSLSCPVNVWLKIDSGMHRMGVPAGLAQSAWWRLQDCDAVAEVRLMTHLASADERHSGQTSKQLACFQAATAGLQTERSIANSAAILSWPDAQADWVRPGIMLYGVSPFEDEDAQSLDLKPVMTLASRLIAVNHFREGDAVGYGASWVCPENMPVGIVSCGYGDGYPRHIAEGTPVLLNGQRVAVIGRVSMDTICIDLRQQPDASVGDKVVLWGPGLSVEEVAQRASTIAYDLLCRVTARVTFNESGTP